MPRQKGRTLAAIDRDLHHLQKEREQVLAAEKAGVVARIKEAIAHYGLSADDQLRGKPPH